jgi:glyoxalase family protein
MITGIHHVTAMTSDGQRNIDFYAGLLGLRVVKVTVNFDDPGSYHLYYGDESGSPSSIMTFFVWPGAHRGRIGNGQVTATAFAVPEGSLDFWSKRLADANVSTQASTRFGQKLLSFVDFDGMALELVQTDVGDHRKPWTTPSLDAGVAIKGVHSVSLGEEGYEHTARLLADTMGFRSVGQEGNRFRYATSNASGGELVDVLCQPDARRGSMGAGTVHHVAWRVKDDASELEWRKKLVEKGLNVSPVMDRTYFHSIYYREPGGVLFEIATDIPGFAVDEPQAKLAGVLKLPAQYEPHRATLRNHLPKLVLPGGVVMP